MKLHIELSIKKKGNSMTKPIKAKNVRILINSSEGLGDIIGVVENLTVEFSFDGGVEPHYGSDTGKHAIGTKRATFTLRRWMYIDTNDDLFYDLLENPLMYLECLS